MFESKKEVRLQLDFMQGPIWLTDIETKKPCSGVEIVDKDSVICKLNEKIWNLYFDYFLFNKESGEMSFDDVKYNKEKPEFERLINQLKERLNEINDGSFYVVDYINDLS